MMAQWAEHRFLVGEFGYTTNSDGSFTFFCKGIDRSTTDSKLFNRIDNSVEMESSYRIWGVFADKLNEYVNSNGGNSEELEQESYEPDYNSIENVIDGVSPLCDLAISGVNDSEENTDNSCIIDNQPNQVTAPAFIRSKSRHLGDGSVAFDTYSANWDMDSRQEGLKFCDNPLTFANQIQITQNDINRNIANDLIPEVKQLFQFFSPNASLKIWNVIKRWTDRFYYDLTYPGS